MEKSVKLIAKTMPIIDGVNNLEEFIAYAARVSNPDNQMNTMTSPKLLKYLITHKHWSPFEMASAVMEINTTRDIGRQILRHRSYSFQEFSQRYAAVDANGFTFRECRLQDHKNRQNSIETPQDTITAQWWYLMQQEVANLTSKIYTKALENGIAKEQARAILPEGLTPTTIYMAGTVRSWIHYCAERTKDGVQKEHRLIAQACMEELRPEIPSIADLII